MKFRNLSDMSYVEKLLKFFIFRDKLMDKHKFAEKIKNILVHSSLTKLSITDIINCTYVTYISHISTSILMFLMFL